MTAAPASTRRDRRPQQARLLAVCYYSDEAVLVGDGWPVFRDGHARLAELGDAAPEAQRPAAGDAQGAQMGADVVDMDGFVTLDCEASSLGSSSWPIEIGIAAAEGRRSWLVRPLPEWHDWSPAAERLHGISRERLRREGRWPSEVAAALDEAVGGRDVIVDSDWDVRWLDVLFRTARRAPRFAVQVVPVSDAELDAQAERAGLRRHRAADDAEALRRALLARAPAGTG